MQVAGHALWLGFSLSLLALCVYVVVRAWAEHREDEREFRREASGPEVLDAPELLELAELGRRIQESLACDANGIGVPCRTDRHQAVEDMLRYCEIHGRIEDEGEADAEDE